MITSDELIKDCNLCSLSGDRYAFPRIHRGDGPKIMFVGMCPGKQEAIEHLAFVGPSGKLLNEWIKILDIDNYYITNVVKHRPIEEYMGKIKDKDPNPTQISACLPYIEAEIKNEKPDYIITLGKVATKAILPEIFWTFNSNFTTIIDKFLSDTSLISVERGYKGIPFFHPSYILRGGTRIRPYLDLLMEVIK